ncbi:MAG: amidase family protein, partial [Pseudomonadota bacterium]
MRSATIPSLLVLVAAAFPVPSASAQDDVPPIGAAEADKVLEAVAEPGFADILTGESLSNIAKAIAAGDVTSEAMVSAYLERITTIDQSGATLQSVLSLNPNALEDAQAADAAVQTGEGLGPLHGVPVLIKDNIETADPTPTTAGALALKDNYAENDAPLIAGLREAGAIILGKTNLSQWANFRSSQSISGWSA